MRSSRALDAVRSLCVSAALAFPALAWGQVSCPLNEYSLDVSLPGGGLIFTGTGVSITVFVVAKSETTLAVYCEAAGGQFPPPTIAGASYRWSTGASEQRIRGVDSDIDWALLATGYQQDSLSNLGQAELSSAELAGHGASSVLSALYQGAYSLSADEIDA